MKTRTTLALLLVLGSAVQPASADGLRKQILDKILPTAVQIAVERDGTRLRTGSGVVIAGRPSAAGSECYVLTAGHVFTGLMDGEIYTIFDRHRGGPGSRVRATLLAHAESGNLDAAVLKIQREAGCVAAEPGNSPALGDDVLALGFPWGKAMTLAAGIVSQVPLEASDSRLMINASVSYGVSGGGVYDGGGHLIGIVQGYRTAQVSYRGADNEAKPQFLQIPVPGETYVVPLAEIRGFLQEIGLTHVLSPR